MNLYRLGKVPGLDSMLIFHALAKLGLEGLVLVSPEKPFVSIGYFQDIRKVVDLDSCRDLGLPVIRREIGGGTVLLDKDQIFFHLVLRKDNPLFTRNIASLYKLVAEPCVAVYRKLGVDAVFRPINDIVTTAGRKVSGLGGADIGDDCVAFVGSIIIDFDYETMTKVLRVPSEKFRDKVYKSLKENLSTLVKETGARPSRLDIEDLMVQEFSAKLGSLEEANLDSQVLEKARELEDKFMDEDFLFMKGKDPGDFLKVSQDASVIERNYKAPGGLITTTMTLNNEVIDDISISGDFTMYPREHLARLESALLGKEREPQQIKQVLTSIYDELQIDSPGVTPGDLTTAICS